MIDSTDLANSTRPCRRCGKPIPAERLEVFPNATRCVECQGKAEDRGKVRIDHSRLNRLYSIGLAEQDAAEVSADELELGV